MKKVLVVLAVVGLMLVSCKEESEEKLDDQAIQEQLKIDNEEIELNATDKEDTSTGGDKGNN